MEPTVLESGATQQMATTQNRKLCFWIRRGTEHLDLMRKIGEKAKAKPTWLSQVDVDTKMKRKRGGSNKEIRIMKQSAKPKIKSIIFKEHFIPFNWVEIVASKTLLETWHIQSRKSPGCENHLFKGVKACLILSYKIERFLQQLKPSSFLSDRQNFSFSRVPCESCEWLCVNDTCKNSPSMGWNYWFVVVGRTVVSGDCSRLTGHLRLTSNEQNRF